MGDLNVIDRFMGAFIRYIDSGFGLLHGDIAFLTTILVGIDITLAGLFWALGGGDDLMGRFLKKILYVGTFALILGRFNALSEIVFRSFAGLGITAGGGRMTADDLLRPGHLASTGYEAASPLLDQVSDLLGPVAFFENFMTISVLMTAWFFIMAAFFVLALQLFITILEFKLTTLAGFVLVPFALWNRTSFLAERVLGNIVSSGIKVMVLAVVIGIGSGFFSEFAGPAPGSEPDLAHAMSMVLASLALFGLGIFGPGIASGLVAGAPQLGAGAAIGTAAAAAGTVAVGAAGARAAAGGALGAVRAGTAMGAAAHASYRLGQETAGSASVGAGLSGVARAGAAAARERAGSAFGVAAAAEAGEAAALRAGSGNRARAGGAQALGPDAADAPLWAQRLRSEQAARHHRHAALQAVREGDGHAAGAAPDIKERED
jgi:type IV secretion system protein TrbL